MSGIVVSLDGSADSQHALEWAVTHATLEHTPLTVLAVHQVAASPWTGNPIIYPADRPEAERAVDAVKEAVSKTMSKLGDGARVHRPAGRRAHRGLARCGHGRRHRVRRLRPAANPLGERSGHASRGMPRGRHFRPAVAARATGGNAGLTCPRLSVTAAIVFAWPVRRGCTPAGPVLV